MKSNKPKKKEVTLDGWCVQMNPPYLEGLLSFDGKTVSIFHTKHEAKGEKVKRCSEFEWKRKQLTVIPVKITYQIKK